MKSSFSTSRIVIIHLFLGAVIGIVLLHPIAMAVAWRELRASSVTTEGFRDFMLSHFETIFAAGFLPMTIGYAFLGGLVGFLFALQYLALARQSQALKTLSNRLADDLPSLIQEGENELIEFKSSLRWDFQQDVIDRSLETVIVKTLAGFMNHRGGSLIVGVTDEGEVVGLKNDYQTLKHKDRDGFERIIMDMVNQKLGAHTCTLIHFMFHEIEGRDVCRILVEPSTVPVYMSDGQVSKYFVRSGNSTRELDAREALAHVTQRRKSGV